MTIAEARAIASGAESLGDVIEGPKTQIKDHGVKPGKRVDCIRYAWESLNHAPFPGILDATPDRLWKPQHWKQRHDPPGPGT